MGNHFTTSSPIVYIWDLKNIVDRTYTVELLCGQKDVGWRTPTEHEPHCCGYATQHTAAVRDSDGKWRIYMMSSIPNTDDLHLCGWKRIESIEPSDGWKEGEIDELIQILESRI
jgi:hypothetical protein